MADTARTDIGFTGGQVLSVRVDAADHESLLQALDDGPRWHRLAAVDSLIALDLSQVVYVRRESDNPHVGF